MRYDVSECCVALTLINMRHSIKWMNHHKFSCRCSDFFFCFYELVRLSRVRRRCRRETKKYNAVSHMSNIGCGQPPLTRFASPRWHADFEFILRMCCLHSTRACGRRSVPCRSVDQTIFVTMTMMMMLWYIYYILLAGNARWSICHTPPHICWTPLPPLYHSHTRHGPDLLYCLQND